MAARAGVSVATVSRVLSGKAATGVPSYDRVMEAVKELDYVINGHARALGGNGPGSVAILVPHLGEPFFGLIAQGAQEQAAAEGRLCLVCSTGGDTERELAAVSLMREVGAEAVLLIGGVVETEDYRRRMVSFARGLDAVGSRLVLVGRPVMEENLPVTVVEYDNHGGSHAITSYLLSKGHQRILHLAGNPHNSAAKLRVQGYRQALADYRIPYDEGLVRWGRDYTRAEGAEVMRAALKDGVRFSAVYGGNDNVAAGALTELRSAGLRVPEDVSLAGYDDTTVAVDLQPRLTTVNLPHEELGRTAVRLALHRGGAARERQHVTLGTHVVVRDSVRPWVPADAESRS
ncbi:LacI family DNA-binding transcriptional regulator [Streptomyces sp. NPDC056405]|uniref:LacI family DNA-binding transcriptional regulator n=1 Tax=Streptomyces sp. NPDC056405 TaxID=3345811 RepID=UPI0035E38651